MYIWQSAVQTTWSDQLKKDSGKPVSTLWAVDTGSGQIDVEEGCNGFARLRDLVVVVVVAAVQNVQAIYNAYIFVFRGSGLKSCPKDLLQSLSGHSALWSTSVNSPRQLEQIRWRHGSSTGSVKGFLQNEHSPNL